MISEHLEPRGFEALGGHWDSISETLGSEGVKGYLGPLLSTAFRDRLRAILETYPFF